MKKVFFLHRFSTAQGLIFSFLLVILCGSILLSLPIMHYSHAPATTYLDHLFNTVSMVCVTGLSVFPIGNVYNGLGQTVSMCLIQIGGLGLVTLISLSFYVLKKKLSLTEQSLLQSAVTYDSFADLKAYLLLIYKVTFAIEGLAALLIMIDFIPRFGLGHGIFNSLFLAVSAFCNAGFDNLGSNSLIPFQLDPLINLVVACLIIAGGLGFAVWHDLLKNVKDYYTKRPHYSKEFMRHLNHHTRLVLQTTAFLLISGTLISWLLEFHNLRTIGRLTLGQQLMVSFFQTVTMRTAGFATISYPAAHPATNLLYILQMLIGGAPGGTAGGLKVTVAAVIFLLVKAELTGHSEVTYPSRQIRDEVG